VADQGDLLIGFKEACLESNVLDESRQVELADLRVAMSPILSIGVGVKGNVTSGVSIASSVEKPDIVALLGSDESWSLLSLIHDPTVGRINQSVDHGNHRLVDELRPSEHVVVVLVDSEHVVLESVFCDDLVGLHFKSSLVTDLFEGFECVIGNLRLLLPGLHHL